MTIEKTKRFRLTPTLILIWVFVALASALVTWLILMKDDVNIYRAAPSTTIPLPTDEVYQKEVETKIDAPQLKQSKLEFRLDPGSAKIGVIITNLGLQHDLTQHAIANLPAYVTTSFSPYTHNKNELFKAALDHQHEIMIDIPMTLTGEEVCDGGPCAIEAGLSAEENYRKIKRILSGTQGCIGLNCFDTHANAEKLVKALIPHFSKDPFLLVAHSNEGSSAFPPSVITPMAFQEDATEDILSEQIDRAEKSLTKGKTQILIGRATPILIETLQKWGKTLNKKHIQLIPLSATAHNE